ncbi:hypothetical protein Tco_1312717 [Tanacetum coccineum]
MSNTNTNLQTQTSSVLQNDTVSSCSISKVQEKTQLSRIKCMKSLRAIQSQLKFLTDTLQDFGTMPIFKRTFSQDLDLLEQHLTKEIISQTDCKTTLTKLRTTFENAFNSEIKAQDSNSELASTNLQRNAASILRNTRCSCIKYKMSKAKERCIPYFRSLHSHLQVLSKDDLKGTRIEHGFKRAFMSLFGQDVDTFTRTMLLNVDQLQKQLDKDKFQEDGSMTAFWVVQHFRDTLLQHLGNVKKSIAERTRHQRQYERRVNKRQVQTQESKIDTGKALDADLVNTESIRTDSIVQDDSSRQHGQILNETSNKAKIEKEIDVLETMNIELEHSVATLRKENETLKQHYKDLYDSIKITRSKTTEQTTSLLANNAELKAQIQEKVFAIAALKNDLRKLKGNSVDTKFDKTSVLGKPVLPSLRNQSVVRQPNAFKSERAQMSKQRFALPKSTFAKPDHMIASSSSRNSSKNMPRFSSNDMVHNHYLDVAKKKIQERDRNSTTSVPTSARIQTTVTVMKETKNPRSTPRTTVSTEVHQAAETVTTSNELDLLFSPLFDEYFNGENQVVLKSSAVTTTDASNKRQQQPDSTSILQL